MQRGRWRLFSILVAAAGVAVLAVGSSPAGAAQPFRRGDAVPDGVLNLTDPLHVLGYLFRGSPAALECQDAADATDDGAVDIADAVRLLFHLFLGAPALPAPFGECGQDPTPDELSCERFEPCPRPPPAPPLLEPPASPTALRQIEVRGTAAPGLRVSVAGGRSPDVEETLAGPDGSFLLTVELSPNRLNRLYAYVTDEVGLQSAPATVEVVQDSEPPFVHIDEPSDGAVVYTERVTVSGRVADLLSGFTGIEVLVNGAPAAIAIGLGANGTFERLEVPLALGENTLVATATDAVGNTATHEARVTREEIPPSADRLELVSGDGQAKRPIHTALPEPIVVRARQADGTPIAGKAVTFRVTRSDGRLASAPGELPEDQVLSLGVLTDTEGLASAYWTLGGDAGCGNNRMQATAAGLAGSVTFCASAAPGPAAQINVATGNNQRAEAGAPAPQPLRAWVSDGCNGIAGVPVTFRVALGTGRVDGAASATVATGPTGHAAAQFVLGPEAGNQAVEADFDGNSGLPATFQAIAVARAAGQPTTFTGLVLDNAEQPIQGALCVLEIPGLLPSPQASTDLNGRFEIAAPRAGPATLRVEGSFATRVGGEAGRDIAPGSFPSLLYELSLVPSAENSLAGPVFLPQLDPGNEVVYDGTSEVVLRVQGVEGLEMRVAAGTTVTLRDRTRIGPGNPGSVRLSLNQVNRDDVPMPMTDGAAPPFAWTLQPAGARFDPPVRVRYPNMAGLPAGAIANFLTYNHDTGKFEIVSSGRVSSDGSVIDSDPGSGISVAGWGAACPPYAVTGGVKRKPEEPDDDENCNFTITHVDPYFAPSVERLHIKYTLVPLAANTVELEVFSAEDPSEPVYTDSWFTAGGFDLDYKQDDVLGWDGRENEDWFSNEYIKPCTYTVRMTVVSSSYEDSAGCSDSNPFAVEVESIELDKAAGDKIVMNEPAHKEPIEATVLLRKKDGSGVATAVPVEVHWSFTDPGDANTPKASSYDVPPPLGKAGDASSIYWEAPRSDDGFKQTCISTTGAGGKTTVTLLPSAVGGDDFQVECTVQCANDTFHGPDVGPLTIVRSVRFDKVYEMQGLTHVSRNATKARIQPYFDPAFVEFDVGPPIPIPAELSVKYVGLYKDAATPQLDWAGLQAKLPLAWTLEYGPHAGETGTTEIPTAQELEEAAYAGDDIVLLAVRDAARVDITKKAQAWTERIDSFYLTSQNAWMSAAGIPNGAMVAIHHYHPKYSSSGGDSATNEWPEWVTVTTFGRYPGVDPDGMFLPGGASFGGQADPATGTVTLPDGFPDARNEVSIAHEVGHATKVSFRRAHFGASGDHSPTAGLMDPNASLNMFTATELKILRGIKP